MVSTLGELVDSDYPLLPHRLHHSSQFTCKKLSYFRNILYNTILNIISKNGGANGPIQFIYPRNCQRFNTKLLRAFKSRIVRFLACPTEASSGFSGPGGREGLIALDSSPPARVTRFFKNHLKLNKVFYWESFCNKVTVG